MTCYHVTSCDFLIGKWRATWLAISLEPMISRLNRNRLFRNLYWWWDTMAVENPQIFGPEGILDRKKFGFLHKQHTSNWARLLQSICSPNTRHVLLQSFRSGLERSNVIWKSRENSQPFHWHMTCKYVLQLRWRRSYLGLTGANSFEIFNKHVTQRLRKTLRFLALRHF